MVMWHITVMNGYYFTNTLPKTILLYDDYIKPQGLVGKYVIPLGITLGMGISHGEVEQPETRESPEVIDAIHDKENNNDILGGEGEHEELDGY